MHSEWPKLCHRAFGCSECNRVNSKFFDGHKPILIEFDHRFSYKKSDGAFIREEAFITGGGGRGGNYKKIFTKKSDQRMNFPYLLSVCVCVETQFCWHPVFAHLLLVEWCSV